MSTNGITLAASFAQGFGTAIAGAPWWAGGIAAAITYVACSLVESQTRKATAAEVRDRIIKRLNDLGIR